MRATPERRAGIREGLAMALAILAEDERKLAERLETGASAATRRDQRVRHKALQRAQTRVRTALHAHDRADQRRGVDDADEIRASLARIGL